MEHSSSAGGTIGSLSDRRWAVIWTASVLQSIGLWIQIVATGWLVAHQTDSAFVVTLVYVASTLPSVVLIVPAGILADAVTSRPVVVALSLAAQGVILCILAVLVDLGQVAPGLIIGAVLLLGIADAIAAPSWHAAVVDFVSAPHRESAIALNRLSFQVGRTAGPGLGGIFVSVVGPAASIVVAAVCYAALAVVLVLRDGARRRDVPQSGGRPQALWDGVVACLAAPRLRVFLVMLALLSFGSGGLLALFPKVALQWTATPEAYGTLLGFYGGGAVVGILLTQRVLASVGLGLHVPAAAAVFYAVVLGLGTVVVSDTGAYLAVGLAGAAISLAMTTVNILVQNEAGEHDRGRIMALYLLVMFAGLAGGGAVWGLVAVETSVLLALRSAAIVVGLGAVVWVIAGRSAAA